MMCDCVCLFCMWVDEALKENSSSTQYVQRRNDCKPIKKGSFTVISKDVALGLVSSNACPRICACTCERVCRNTWEEVVKYLRGREWAYE